MALIVTAGGSDSDSYIGLEDETDSGGNVTAIGFKTYAGNTDLSLKLPNGQAASDQDLEQALRRGTILIDGYGDRFPGARSSGDQALCWPRTSATRLDGSPISSGSIPKAIRDATCWAAAYALANPADINQVIQQHRVVKKEKIGAIERTYADLEDVTSLKRTLTAVDDILNDLLKPSEADKARTGDASSPTAFMFAGRPR